MCDTIYKKHCEKVPPDHIITTIIATIVTTIIAEAFNNTYKEEYTYRERLPMGKFAESMEDLCAEGNHIDDGVLFGPR